MRPLMSFTSILSLPETQVFVTSCWTQRERWSGFWPCGRLDAGAAGGNYETPAPQSGSALRHWSSARRLLPHPRGGTARQFLLGWRALPDDAAHTVGAAWFPSGSGWRYKPHSP